MKILIFVPTKLALANGSNESGAIDYDVSPGLAWEIGDRCLDTVAGKFAVHHQTRVAPDVHRLVCACASDDAILDALLSLKHQIDMARSWARARLTDGPGIVPDYVDRLWIKHPVGLYRDLLGPDVAWAIQLSASPNV